MLAMAHEVLLQAAVDPSAPPVPTDPSLCLSKTQSAKPKAAESNEAVKKRLLADAHQLVRAAAKDTTSASGVLAAFSSEATLICNAEADLSVFKSKLNALVRTF